jgi:hypothetical protein
MKPKKLVGPVGFMRAYKFGFMAGMLQRKEPLLLFKGGYWRLRSVRSWHTDISVVAEADGEGYLAKLVSPPEDCLDGRVLTTKGAAFASDLLRRIPATPRRKATTTSVVSYGTASASARSGETPVRPPVLLARALEILQEVEAQILSDPNCFSLRACCESVPEFKTRAYPDKYPKSGMIACLAGLTCLCVARKKIDDVSTLKNKSHFELAAIGASALGLSVHEANRLFAHWSFEFLQQYRHSTSAQERAQVAVERIRRFVETGE